MRATLLPACLILLLPSLGAAQETGWPRSFESNGSTVVVHQPQVDRWTDFQVLEARAAVVVQRPEQAARVGALSVVADTVTDHEAKTVVFDNILVSGLRFPDTTAGEAAELAEIVKRSLPKSSLPFALERVTAMAAEGGTAVRSVNANLDPPPMFFSPEPALLVITLGEPTLQAIEGTKLFFVTNTNWDLIHEPSSGNYYLRFQQSWLSSKTLTDGSWSSVPGGALPMDFRNLPETDDWAEVRAAVPGERATAPPRVFVATQPAELIQTDGSPKYRPISGTNLLQVENTRSDVFYQGQEGAYYVLTSGRWFRAFSLAGPWSAATEDLPADFLSIPETDAASRVLASVPGSALAEEAVLQAQVPTTASVNRDQAASTISYDGDPQFIPIEDTGVSFAANSPQDIFLVRDRYYLCTQGIWFVANSATGPWTVADRIPPEIYKIPSTHPKHNVTYVYVYDSSPETVVVGYTSGYSGSYVVSGVVVYGLGWWIWDDYWDDHYWWNDHYYHYHYHGHWHGYGGGHYYDHGHGVWRREGWAYGPYGGVGGSSWYDPSTGAWARKGAAYGPYQARGFAQGYNPRTDTYAATLQGSNAYEHWGRGVVERDGNWARTGHYGNDRGTVGGIRTSEGGKAIVGRGEDGQGGLARTGEGDLYAGRDGNVYRREDGQWQKGGKDGWKDVEPAGDRAAGTRRQSGTIDAKTLNDRFESGGGFSRSQARSAAEARGYDANRSSLGSSRSGQGTSSQLNRDARARSRSTNSSDRSRSSSGSRSSSWSGSSSRRSSGSWSGGGSGSRSRSSAGSRGGSRGGGGRRR
jgi:hypothetical protein